MTEHSIGKSSPQKGSVGPSVLHSDCVLEHPVEQLHFPFLYESKDGTWYMTYREGPHGLTGGDRIHCSLSRDQGVSWEAYPGLCSDSPSLRLFYRELSNGTLLADQYQSKLDESGDPYIEMLRSENDGRNWVKQNASLIGLPTEVRRCGMPTSFWGGCVELEPGHLIQGFYGQNNHARLEWDTKSYVNGVFESRDAGRSWHFLSYISTDPSLGPEGPNELDLEVLRNGDILGVFRTGSTIYTSRSIDQGKSWSPLKDSKVEGVSPQLLLLGNGVLVMSYGTRDVYVRASLDGLGTNWTEPLLLYKGPGSGYTHLQALGSDRFRVVFDQSAFYDKTGLGGKIIRLELAIR